MLFFVSISILSQVEYLNAAVSIQQDRRENPTFVCRKLLTSRQLLVDPVLCGGSMPKVAGFPRAAPHPFKA
jgi:hypothetical protein